MFRELDQKIVDLLNAYGINRGFYSVTLGILLLVVAYLPESKKDRTLTDRAIHGLQVTFGVLLLIIGICVLIF